MWKTFVRLQNPMMKWLLRSPLHFFVSGMYMLLSFTGRKSGKVYTTPVQYARDGQTLRVITSESYIWWKNLRGGTEVQMRIAGQDYKGMAQTSTKPEEIADAVQRIYPRLSPETRANFIGGKVLITIEIGEPV
jgi:deazaflavin-dependent oxidoreductase (nitroreductase family)